MPVMCRMRGVGTCAYIVVRRFGGFAKQRPDPRHGLNTNNTLDRHIRLVRHAGDESVIRTELVIRNQGSPYHVLGPLVEKIGLRYFTEECQDTRVGNLHPLVGRA